MSNISISYDPKKYIEAVSSLVSYTNLLEETPTLINYMGFTQGIGFKILSATLIYVKPTDIVEIRSKKPGTNFKTRLHKRNIEMSSNFFIESKSDDFSQINANLHEIGSMSDEQSGSWTPAPRQLREMCILAYFSQIVDPETNSLFCQDFLYK